MSNEIIRLAEVEVHMCLNCPFFEGGDVGYCSELGRKLEDFDPTTEYIHDDCPLPAWEEQ